MVIANIESRTVAPGGFTTAAGLRIPATVVVQSDGTELNPAAPVLAAGENHVGQVAGYGFDVSVTPAVTAGAYAAGDIVGALMSFSVARANDEAVVITGVQITCKSAVTPSYDLILLNADPSGTTQTDNAAYSLAVADAGKVIRSLPLVTLGAAWYDHGTPNTLGLHNLGIVAKPVSGAKTILALLVDRTGVTLGSTSDISVRLVGLGV